ncbi:MAG: hypothetical protein Q7J24_14955 [Desulfomicrobium sp.]|nr:hypothetical protein [Desulfomicrobium sp.]
MIDSREKLYFLMLREPFSRVRTAFIQRSRVESDRIKDSRLWMEEQGFEVVDVDKAALVTRDGREVQHGFGKAWALRPEVHAERLAQAFAEKKQRQESRNPTKSVAGTEDLSTITCPKCGDSLQHTAVCPKCAAGKLGYRHRYACVCGGVDLVSKEAL